MQTSYCSAGVGRRQSVGDWPRLSPIAKLRNQVSVAVCAEGSRAWERRILAQQLLEGRDANREENGGLCLVQVEWFHPQL